MAATATDDQAATGQAVEKPTGLKLLMAAFRNRKLGVQLAFGFSSGLPYALLLGTLYAWLGEAKVDLETMGVFSLIGLAYSFKFLWSPAVDRVQLPLLGKLGRRRGWIALAQIMIGAFLIIMSMMNPSPTTLGWFSLMAGLGAFASATQDIVIDAWRVDVADETATLEILSAMYQLGYRIAALMGGALALILAQRLGWPAVYGGMGVLMLLLLGVTLMAPDTPRPAADLNVAHLREVGELQPKIRSYALIIVGLLWAWALVTVLHFMIVSLSATPENRPDSKAFIQFYGPLIVIATVIIPGIIAAFLEHWRRTGRYVLASDTPAQSGGQRSLDYIYNALITPLAELVGRLRWAAILVLAIILTYRLTDAIWGPFALPFYIQELGYTNDDVAVASKIFGVVMLMIGISLGAVSFATLGRMPTLIFGAITAALTNLLYADLAAGGYYLDLFGQNTGFYALISGIGGIFGFDHSEKLARLMLAIAGENLASGLAGAAYVAYLSSIVSKKYSAVQYALMSSLTFLVGTLGRGALGQTIEERGYVYIFWFATGLGMIAVVLCIIEWIRQSRQPQTVAPDVVQEAHGGS